MEGYGENVVLIAIGRGPPLALAKAFSRSSYGRIFPLFSRVMREGLLTGPRPKGRTRVLSGPIFSVPHDCADLVNSLQAFGVAMFFYTQPSTLRRR